MALQIKSLDDMIREVIATLQAGVDRRPAFALLLGSGFSFPIIPTPVQMLKGDIAWWRFCKRNRIGGEFGHPSAAIAKGDVNQEEIAEHERELWKTIHDKVASTESRAFAVGGDGLPLLNDPESIGRAYQAIMSEGLATNKMRRQYLRDAIARSHPKVNAAHIFLAGILEAQESWRWGAPFCRTIFTTNFDPLLQRSLQLVNKLYYMTDRPEVLEPPDDDESEAIHLVYTHGSVHRFELLNTGDQIDYARKKNAPALVDYFRKHGVMVIGYSGWSDTTMDALRSCPSFDSNLYWCDMHPAADAEARLRPEALEILHAREKSAYYVPIASADEAMRQLHRELKLGDIPKFILAPVATMIAQLKSIEVPAEAAAAAESETKRLPGNLAALLDGTLSRLEVAKSAFDDPSIVRPASPEGAEEVGKALIAQLLSDAEVAYSEKKYEQAIALLSSVVAAQQVPPEERARALFRRGLAYDDSDKFEEAIADYSAVIAMADAPARQKTFALFNRALIADNAGKTAEAIADYSAILAVPGASDAIKAEALLNRGVIHARAGQPDDALDDYSAAIAIADTATEIKTKALFNRGQLYRDRGEMSKAIDDFSVVIATSDAPPEQRAAALVSRGVLYAANGNDTEAIEVYEAVIAMPDAPADQRATAFGNRGWELFKSRDDAGALVADSRRALELVPTSPTARMNLALGLLLTGDRAAAAAEYETLLSQTPDPEVIRSAIADLEAEVSKRPDLPDGAKLLDRLKSAAEEPAAQP